MTRRPTLGTALGIVAVVIAMCGVSFAAGVTITSSKQIKNGIVTSADIKNKTITANDVKQTPWRHIGAAGQPGFLNGWSNYLDSYAPVSFRKGPDGRVYMRGVAMLPSNVLSSDYLFYLPTGFRPKYCTNLPASSFDGSGDQSVGSVEICPDGSVGTYGFTDERFLSFEGVAFATN